MPRGSTAIVQAVRLFGQPVSDSRRTVERDRRYEVHVRVQRAVVRSEQVRAVIGMEMRDPDRIKLIQPHMPLERAERPHALTPAWLTSCPIMPGALSWAGSLDTG